MKQLFTISYLTLLFIIFSASATHAQITALSADGGIQLTREIPTHEILYTGPSALNIYNQMNNAVHLGTSNSPRLSISGGGKVGIGLTNPVIDLQIKQQSAADANPDGLVNNPSGLMIEAPDDSAVLMYIDNSNDLNFAFGAGILTTQRSWIQDTSGDYFNTSDRRLKTNIYGMSSVLENVLELRPSFYQFRDNKDQTMEIGLIAQEVEKLFPEVVTTKNGMKAICYSKLSVLAIKAIQEQQREIDRLVELESRLNALESRMNTSSFSSEE